MIRVSLWLHFFTPGTFGSMSWEVGDASHLFLCYKGSFGVGVTSPHAGADMRLSLRSPMPRGAFWDPPHPRLSILGWEQRTEQKSEVQSPTWHLWQESGI